MSDLKVGMYVRTKKGYICRLLKEDDSFYYLDITTYKGGSCSLRKHDVKNTCKWSENIIDLIEIGDYVNGYRVMDIYYEKLIESIVLLINCDEISNRGLNKITDDDIKSILTHEQYESNVYRVNDEETDE